MNGPLEAYSKQRASASAQPTTNMPSDPTRRNGVQPITLARTLKGRNVTLRAALPGDATSMARIGAAGFSAAHGAALPPGHLQAYLASAWSEKQVAAMIANPAIHSFVVQIEQSVIGLASLNPLDPPSYLRQPAAVEVSRFFLHRDWIGTGVGSALMTHLLYQAALTGYRTCWLRVWQGNQRAIAFYQQWGFKRDMVATYPVNKTPLPVWVMVHALNFSEMNFSMQPQAETARETTA